MEMVESGEDALHRRVTRLPGTSDALAMCEERRQGRLDPVGRCVEMVAVELDALERPLGTHKMGPGSVAFRRGMSDRRLPSVIA